MTSTRFSKVLLFFFLGLATFGFADQMTFDNMTKYPTSKTKMAVQWANSARDVDESNRDLMQGINLKPDTLQFLSKSGKINVSIPDKAQHFRVLVWTKDAESPDLHTNWVDAVPNKTYTLKQDQLIPTVLIHGTGC